ncbi:MAG: hypothetical protein GF383_15880 [Candidatus Lokiarchaeota archaeon]|nr:hypothetical protein [Candidatus Lokiarchaeota archaeon]
MSTFRPGGLIFSLYRPLFMRKLNFFIKIFAFYIFFVYICVMLVKDLITQLMKLGLDKRVFVALPDVKVEGDTFLGAMGVEPIDSIIEDEQIIDTQSNEAISGIVLVPELHFEVEDDEEEE